MHLSMGYLMFKYVKALRKHRACNSVYFNIFGDPWNKAGSAASTSAQSLKPPQREVDTSVFSQLPPLLIIGEGKGLNLKMFFGISGCSRLLPGLGTCDNFLEERWAC